jgi:predicted Zn-dependent peptidase
MMLRFLFLTGCLALSAADSLQGFPLPNGLRVLLIENHDRPLVRLELRTAWDPAEEPPGKAGLGGFLAAVLKASTPRDREAFQQFLEDRALRFSFTMQPRSFAWSVLSDSQGQDGAFESLAMGATRREFDGLTVETQRQSYRQAFKERTPRVRAEDQFRRRVGDPSRSLQPEEESLDRIEFQDLLSLSRRVLRPEKSVLVIQGDMNLPQAKQLAMLHLGAWGPGTQAALSPMALPEQPPPTRTWMIREAGRGIEIKVGAALPPAQPLSASILAIYAGLVKRELASGLPPALAKAEFHPFPDGAWMLTAVAAPEKSVSEAMEAVQLLLTRLRGKGIDSGDLAAARMTWNTEMRTRVLHPQQEADALAERALRLDGLAESVDQLRAEDLQAALRRLFSTEASSYFIVGAVPQDAIWLVKAGFGPVATIN